MEQGAPYPLTPPHSLLPPPLTPYTLSPFLTPSALHGPPHSFTVLPIPNSSFLPAPLTHYTTSTSALLNPPQSSLLLSLLPDPLPPHTSSAHNPLCPVHPLPVLCYPFTGVTLLCSHLPIFHTLHMPLASPPFLHPPYSHLPHFSHIPHIHTCTLTRAQKTPPQTAFCPVAF